MYKEVILLSILLFFLIWNIRWFLLKILHTHGFRILEIDTMQLIKLLKSKILSALLSLSLSSVLAFLLLSGDCSELPKVLSV